MSNYNEIGLLPPQATDLEEAVIGAILLEEKALVQVIDFIIPDVFYKPANAIIYAAAMALNAQGEPIDILTVVEYLKQQGELEQVGGAYYISQLTNKVASSANIQTHARIVYQKYIGRAIISLAAEMSKTAYEQQADVFDMLSEAMDRLGRLTQFKNVNMLHISETIRSVFRLMDANAEAGTTLTGIPTGFKRFDDFSGGMQRGDLVILGGETSNGKTSLALDIARNAAMAEYTVGIYSYEMTSTQITGRLMAATTEISSKRILMQPLDGIEFQQINSKIDMLVDQNIYIDDGESSEFKNLCAAIRVAHNKHGLDLVVIDYLQLINNSIKGKSTEEQVADMANKLKALAKALNIVIICISQLARDKERPQPSRARLKRSGDIENAADIIMLIWLPAMYNIEEITMGSTGESYYTGKLGHCIVPKGRNIGTIDFPLSWNSELTHFSNYEEQQTEAPPISLPHGENNDEPF